MYINLEMCNCKLECGIPTGVFLDKNKYELKTGDEVQVFTFTNFLVWKGRAFGIVEKIEDGYIRILTNKETIRIVNDDKSKDEKIKLSRKQSDYSR